MAIVEFVGGEINHRYLMRKTKGDLLRMYRDNRDHFGGGGLLSDDEVYGMTKHQIATEVLRQFRRMPKD